MLHACRLFKEYLSRHQVMERLNQAVEVRCSEQPTILLIL
jgi:hypothetical protein